jgi:CubicO group peptidase (beta-lactamase class C family)
MTTAVSTRDLIETEPEQAGMSAAGLERIKRLVQGYVDTGKLPGAISMVARRGEVVHCETYGQRDVEAALPMTWDTIFRFYSMTKPIASVALMTLYEEGKFQLDEPVSKFIPELQHLKVFAGGTADKYDVREPARAMTVRDLLTHTSGLVGTGDGTVVGSLYERAGLHGSSSTGTLAEMIAKLGELPLHCDPGAEWNYGISTDVVGYLCEVLSGMNFDRFLQERVFAPLGKPDTGYHVPERALGRFATNHRRDAAEPSYTVIDRPDASSVYANPRTYFSGAGGLVSTAADYMRFCKLLANGGQLDSVRILGPRTLEFMTANHLPGGRDLAAMGQPRFSETTMEGIGFGLGFAVLLDPAVAHVLGTPGEYYWGGAASTAFFISPRDELIMLFLTQLMPSSSYPIRRQLRQTIYSSIID